MRPVLFAGIEVAARVERAERSLIDEAARASVAAGPPSSTATQRIAGGLAVWAAMDSPFNKVVGTGMDGDPLTDDDLDAVESMFEQHNSPVQFEVATLADPAIAAHLTRRGYVLAGFEPSAAAGTPPSGGRGAARESGAPGRPASPRAG